MKKHTLLIYGSVAAIIAFLTWAYLSSLIFLFGAYLHAAYYRLKQQQRETASISNGSPLAVCRRDLETRFLGLS